MQNYSIYNEYIYYMLNSNRKLELINNKNDINKELPEYINIYRTYSLVNDLQVDLSLRISSTTTTLSISKPNTQFDIIIENNLIDSLYLLDDIISNILNKYNSVYNTLVFSTIIGARSKAYFLNSEKYVICIDHAFDINIETILIRSMTIPLIIYGNYKKHVDIMHYVFDKYITKLEKIIKIENIDKYFGIFCINMDEKVYDNIYFAVGSYTTKNIYKALYKLLKINLTFPNWKEEEFENFLKLNIDLT